MSCVMECVITLGSPGDDFVNKICCHIIRVGNLYRLEKMGVSNNNSDNYKKFLS